jgi:hypothetical protein
MSQELAVIDSQEIIEQPQAPLSAMPVMDVAQAVERHKMFTELVSKLLQEGVDYGKIPGTNQQSLLKPGAEKLCVFFGLQPNMMLQESKEDWERGFFYYRYRVDLWRGNTRVASCEGSANSYEKKYRYIWTEKPKPKDPQVEADLKARGIGRNRQAFGKWRWEERIENPNPYDLVNTLKKMAQKRAYVGATLMATSATGFFAHFDEADDHDGSEPPAAKPANGNSSKAANGQSKPNGEKAVKMISSEAELADEFYKRGRAAGIAIEDLRQTASQVASGALTWTEAIEQLPEE